MRVSDIIRAIQMERAYGSSRDGFPGVRSTDDPRLQRQPMQDQPKPIVHFVGNASQPYVQFFCDEVWGYVWPGTGDELEPGIHAADPQGEERTEQRLYSFDEEKVTCEACRAKLGARPPRDRAAERASHRRLAARGLLNPGSDAAIALGCACPVLDNARGRGVEGRFVKNLSCPIHGEDTPPEGWTGEEP